jgi:protein-tyrosine-phosphatase
VIAEHLAREKFRQALEPVSAGLYPQTATDTRHALDALRQCGIKIPHHQPKAVRFVDLDSFDLIVTMDREVYDLFLESFPAVSTRKIEQWDVADPWDKDEAYRTCVENVLTKMKTLVGRLESSDFADAK